MLRKLTGIPFWFLSFRIIQLHSSLSSSVITCRSTCSVNSESDFLLAVWCMTCYVMCGWPCGKGQVVGHFLFSVRHIVASFDLHFGSFLGCTCCLERQTASWSSVVVVVCSPSSPVPFQGCITYRTHILSLYQFQIGSSPLFRWRGKRNACKRSAKLF